MEICLSAHLKFLPISFEATESSVQTFSKVRPALCPAVNFRTNKTGTLCQPRYLPRECSGQYCHLYAVHIHFCFLFVYVVNVF